MSRKLTALAAAAACALALAPAAALAQRALVYCPVGIDEGGCAAAAAALASRFPDGVDRGYDGSGGTVDLVTADLWQYAVLVVPSLADNASTRPYALLRRADVAERLGDAVMGRVAVWSGTPDLGSANREPKDALLRNLAGWAAGSYAAVKGPGIVALLDLSDEVTSRYDWLRAITGVNLVADGRLQTYASVRALTPTGSAVLGSGGGVLAYASMAAYGVQLPQGAAGAALDAVGQTGTSVGGQVVLMSAPGGNTGGAVIRTDRDDYPPGDTVTITGTGFQPGETVAIVLHEDPEVHDNRTLTATADALGGFVNRDFAPEQHHLDVRFVVTATGRLSGVQAQTTFTDGTASGVTGFSAGAPAGCTSAGTPSVAVGGTLCAKGTTSVSGAGGADFRIEWADPSGNVMGTNTFLSQSGGATITGSFSPASAAAGNWTVRACKGATSGSSACSGGTLISTVVNFTVTGKLSQSITFGALAGKSFGDPPFAVAATASSGLPVSFASLTTGTCTVAGSTVTIVAAGTCTVRASQPGNGTYNPAADVDQSFTISPAAATVTFLSTAPASLVYEGTYSPSASSNSDGALGISAGGACSMSGSTVTMTSGTGTCTVTASVPATTNYTAATATQTITAAKATPTISWSNPADITYGTALGAAQLNASAAFGSSPVAGTFTYTPAAGTVLGAGSGQALAADFTPTDDASFGAVAGTTVSINVLKATPTVSFTSTAPASLAFGGTYTPAAATNGDGTLSLGASGACSLSGGVVTMTSGVGACTVTASVSEGANYAAAAAAPQTIAAAKAAGSVSFTSASPGTLAFNGTYSPTTSQVGDGAVTLSVGAGDACSLAGGTVTITAGSGSCTVTATLAETGNYTGGTASQTITAAKAAATVSLDAGSLSHTYDGSGKSATATTSPGGLGVTITYGQGGSPVASPVAAGSYDVSASVDDANYQGSATGTLVIGKATPSVSFTSSAPATLAYHGTYTPTASTTGDGALTIGAGGACSIAGGVVTIDAGSGTCTVTASVAEGANYLGAAATPQSISAAKAAATLTLGGLSHTYDGSPRGASAATSPGGLTVVLSYEGTGSTSYGPSATAPANAGTYSVTGTISDANYEGSDTQPLTIGQADATINVNGYTGTYDGAAHGASGTATGVGGANLSSGLNLGATFTDAPGGTANWSFTGGTNYNDATGTAAITIQKADAVISVNGYTGTYDGAAHGASGTATGVGGADLSSGLNLGATFTDAPGGTANWSFTGGTNYNDANGTAAITIQKADAVISVTGYTGVYDGAAHGASGTATGVGGANLSSGLNLGATFTDAPGGTANWSFTGGANYNDATGTAAITIQKADAVISVNGYTGTYDGAAHGATGTATGVGGANLTSGLNLGATFSDAPGGTANWIFTGGTNYNDATGTAAITIQKADATTDVNGYTGTYDGAAHGATGTATGVGGAYLSSGLNLGATFTDAPGGTANWSFTGGANYNDATGTAAITIQKADAVISVNGY
ncbi:MAG TPA: MBG domain-containing protein, partial [Longimicrobium sp.]